MKPWMDRGMRSRWVAPSARSCRNCRLSGWRSLADGRLVTWCLQRDRELGPSSRRPGCSDFAVDAALESALRRSA
ncbi:MAG: hypothetical protein HY554_09920 [Elusimicrobia bacterium]|nr:hypothetical protein [Elusimicrobiota bacterium]